MASNKHARGTSSSVRGAFKPTVVERSQGLRSSGNPVDVRGPALPVVEAMGVVPSLRAAATRTTRMASGRLLPTLCSPVIHF